MRIECLSFVVLLSVASKELKAQYQPMVEEGKYWIYLDHLEEDHPPPARGHAITFLGDTTINSMDYKKVFWYQLKGSHPCQFPPCFEFDIPYQSEGGFLLAFIREDTVQKKIFILPVGSGDIFCEPSEYLLFDFSLGVGDTLNDCVYEFIGANNSNFQSWGIVDSIKVTEKFGKNRNTIYTYGFPSLGGDPFDDKVLIFEGVGLEFYGVFHEPLSYLVDFCEDGMVSCQLISSTIGIESNKEVIIFPNPTKGVCQITLDGEEINSIRLYSALGQIRSEYKRTNTIDLSNLETGIYFLEISLEEGDHIIKKVVKEN